MKGKHLVIMYPSTELKTIGLFKIYIYAYLYFEESLGFTLFRILMSQNVRAIISKTFSNVHAL